MTRAKDFFDGVQHAGADVAVDHTNGTQNECAKRRLRGCQKPSSVNEPPDSVS